MLAVITGDIINSRNKEASSWLPRLKEVLQLYGSTPNQWEISRGDSFQLSTVPEDALKAAFHIKAAIKEFRDLDVRTGIGIGEQNHRAAKISESNGTAFIRSGESFEALKKQNLGIVTGQPDLDEQLNLLLSLALLTANNWSPTVATTIKAFFEHPNKNQTEMAAVLGKSQSSLSEALKRGGYDEITRLEKYYRKQIKEL
ncbi:hypothetical protein [Salinimicrobium xinjiangense]|uniref:hypothetical protein n=1 Tax=Salinimicrobium xinjiangense TaxID=438596 RepID=UPI000421C45A|nr:hypothetical protein [Salinimicrobium xinjiangense]